ncbi:MAG: initiation control protein YabA [Bacillota bacterium]
MQDLAADLAKIRRHVQNLEDENERLRVELARAAGPVGSDPAGVAAASGSRGMDNLVNLYDRGFHICNDYFGRVRNGDCLFCAALMQKGMAVTPSEG